MAAVGGGASHKVVVMGCRAMHMNPHIQESQVQGERRDNFKKTLGKSSERE